MGVLDAGRQNTFAGRLCVRRSNVAAPTLNTTSYLPISLIIIRRRGRHMFSHHASIISVLYFNRKCLVWRYDALLSFQCHHHYTLPVLYTENRLRSGNEQVQVISVRVIQVTLVQLLIQRSLWMKNFKITKSNPFNPFCTYYFTKSFEIDPYGEILTSFAKF